MRSSQNIVSATSPASVSGPQNMSVYKLKEAISPGSCSTVPGTRPKAMIYKNNKLFTVDYPKLAGFVAQHLRTLDTQHLKCAVLTGGGISAKWIGDRLRKDNIPVSCYHAGAEMFDQFEGTPIYRGVRDDDGGVAELTSWLKAESGILVTSEVQFRGAEADYVIFVTQRYWGGTVSIGRSPLTRAVAGLVVLTSDFQLSISQMKRHWDVQIMEPLERLRDETPPESPKTELSTLIKSFQF